MEILQVPHIFLIHSKTKFKRLEAFLIKILFIREHFCLKTIKYMLMVMKMIMPIFTILFKKHGKKNDYIMYQDLNSKI
jgi:hypothetical protein